MEEEGGMKRWLWWFLLIALLIFPQSAVHSAAQAELEMDRVLVDLWPEYDRPSLLVIYRMTLSPEASLPARVSLRIPREAGEPFNVASQDMDGVLYTLDFETRPDGEWTWVSFTTASQEVQLEYYDPRLTRGEVEHAFTFEWPADYTVRTLTVQIQQPVNATEMRLQPEMGSGRQGQDGLTYYTSVVGKVQAGNPFRVSAQYNKTDKQLSANLQLVMPVAPINQNTEGKTGLTQALPWVLAAAGGVLIIGGLVWYWVAGRSSAARQGRRLRHARREAAPGEEPVYCHQCGKQAKPGDAFCRTCGSRLRMEG